MKKLPRIVSTEPVIHGVLKIVWSDGYEGVVDLRPEVQPAEGQESPLERLDRGVVVGQNEHEGNRLQAPIGVAHLRQEKEVLREQRLEPVGAQR